MGQMARDDIVCKWYWYVFNIRDVAKSISYTLLSFVPAVK